MSASAAISAGWSARWSTASRWRRSRRDVRPNPGRCVPEEPMPSTIIRNGTVVTARDTTQADVLIEGEQIKEVRAGIEANGATVIDATGMYVMPGGIDAH